MQSKPFYNYVVYEDGRIWSNYIQRYLKHDIVNNYHQVTLTINNVRTRFKVHRLVAMCFIPNPNNFPQINHIDGNKNNNHVSNLEWCTSYYNNKHARDNGLNNVKESNSKRWNDDDFRSRVSSKISETHMKRGITKGENNPRFRYRIYLDGNVVSRQELAEKLNMSLSYISEQIREASHGNVCKLFADNNVHVVDTKKSQSTIESTVDNNGK